MLNNPSSKAEQSNPEVPSAVLYSLGKKQGVQFSNAVNNLGTNVDQFQKDNSHFFNNHGVKAESNLINNIGLASDQPREPSRSKVYAIGANSGIQYPSTFNNFATNIENSDNELLSAIHTSIGTQYPNFIGNSGPNIDKLNKEMSPNKLYSFGTNTGTQYSNLISNLGSNTDPFSKEYSSAILNSMNTNVGTQYPNLINNLGSNTDKANRELTAIIHGANTGALYSNMISNLGPNADQSNQGLTLAILSSLPTSQPRLGSNLGLNTDQAQKKSSSGVLHSAVENSDTLYSNKISEIGSKSDQSKHELLTTLLHDLGITTGSQYNNLIRNLAADQSNKEIPPAVIYSTDLNSGQTHMDSNPRYSHLLQQSSPGFNTGSKNHLNSVLNSAFEKGYTLHNGENLQSVSPHYHATSTQGDGLNLISKNPSTSQTLFESGSYIPGLQQAANMQNIKPNYFTQDNLSKYIVSSSPTYVDKIPNHEEDKVLISPSAKTQPTQRKYHRNHVDYFTLKTLA
ncbi:protein PF14_0175-like [Bombyx mandarina]|uniref:Protein PF14_0175-like n=1 Tax=Bombyx mandarina TaxID=7092 RepID=A0A6J2KHE3_BOMMA|nr:protein PF14_0175-like [Bombyx mandarina]